MAAVNALNSLLRGTSIDDHDEALRLANAAISAPGPADSPEKLTAQHAKVVALLNLDRFDDALRIIASGGDALAARCVLEHAYALYKTGDLAAAAKIAAASSTSSRPLQHIAAQVAYRDEQFDRAAALYADLAPAAAEMGEDTDVRVNALAASAQRSWQGRGQTTVSAGQDAALNAGRREDLEAFETAYNAACAALSRNDVARAIVLLRHAQMLCDGSDELSDDDKRAERLPILMQQAYALTRAGRHADAAVVREAIVADAAPCEGAAQIVAATNIVVAQNAALGTHDAAINPYVVQRQLETDLPAPPTGSDRLFAHQVRILRRNQYAIELQCYKFKGVQARTAKQLKQVIAQSDDDVSNAKKETALSPAALPATVDLGIFGAAAKAELQTGKDALRRILPLLEHRPHDIGLLLTAIQLQLQAKNAEAALGLLESFFQRAEAAAAADAKADAKTDAEAAAAASARFAPGLVALAVSLYKLQGRHTAVRTELAKAVAHWQASSSSTISYSSSPSPQSSTPASLLRAAGVELLRSPNPADQATAAAAFELLYAANPADRVAIAGLVASFASASASAAATATGTATATPEQAARQQKLAALLTPVDQLTKDVDVAALLQGGVAVLAPRAPVVAASKKRASEAAGAATTEPTSKKARTTSTTTTPAKPAALSRQAKKLQAKAAAAGDDSFDLNKKLDPERWLPLRDRSSYRPPKGKKGKRRGEAATMQGGVVKEEETLALAGGAGSVRVEKAPQGPSSSSSAAAKKRKKGRK